MRKDLLKKKDVRQAEESCWTPRRQTQVSMAFYPQGFLWLWGLCFVFILATGAGADYFERTKTATGEQWETLPSKRPLIRQQRFMANRSLLKVVCLGGSVTYGFPMPKDAAYPHLLDKMLKGFYPSLSSEVISFGLLHGNAKNLWDAMDEALALNPSVLVLEVGSMEALQAWASAGKALPRAFLNEDHVDLPALDRSMLGALSEEEMLAQCMKYTQKIIKVAKDRGVDVLLLYPGSNLRFHPVYDDSEARTPESIQKEVAAVLDLASQTEDENPAYSLRCTKRAVDLVPHSSAFRFLLAEKLLRYGQNDEARDAYRVALELDQQPLRARSALTDALKKCAEEMEIPFIDGQKMANAMSAQGIAGYDLYFDALHPRRDLHLGFAKLLAHHLGADLAGKEEALEALSQEVWDWTPNEVADMGLRLSRSLAFTGKVKFAIQQLQADLEQNPSHLPTLLWMAKLLVQTGADSFAVGLVNQILKNQNWQYLPLTQKRVLAELLAYLSIDEPLNALLEKVKNTDGESWAKTHGLRLMNEKKWDAALVDLQRALRLNPMDPMVLVAIEAAYLHQEDWLGYLDFLGQRLVEGRGYEKLMMVLKRIKELDHVDAQLADKACMVLGDVLLGRDDREVGPWLLLADLQKLRHNVPQQIVALERALMISTAYDIPLNRSLVKERIQDLQVTSMSNIKAE